MNPEDEWVRSGICLRALLDLVLFAMTDPELSYELVPPWVYAFSKLNNGEVEIALIAL